MHQLKHTLPLTPIAGTDLYNTIRAALVARGTSFNAWCQANSVNRQTAEKALKGERFGRRASLLRQRIVTELLVER